MKMLQSQRIFMAISSELWVDRVALGVQCRGWRDGRMTGRWDAGMASNQAALTVN